HLEALIKRLSRFAMTDKQVQARVRDAAGKVVKELTQLGIHTVLVSGGSAAINYTALESAWHSEHPDKPLRILAISGAMNEELYQKYTAGKNYDMKKVK